MKKIMKSYFNHNTVGFNPYQVLTIHPTELSVFGSHTFHELMIADKVRMNAYKKAITQAGKDRSQSVWVDIGAGLCPLTLLVAKWAQPKKIYAIEQVEPIINLARNIIQSQSSLIRRKIELLHGTSSEIVLPQKADILLTETIGNFGMEEGILQLINDAKKRFLKKDAIIIPAEIEFIASPIESNRCYQRINFWKKTQCGLDFSAIVPRAVNTVYHHRALPSELLASPHKMGNLNFSNPGLIQEKISLQSTYMVTRTGILHGFIGWFKAYLYNDIFLSNDPLKKNTPFNWTQAFFPLPEIEKKTIKVKKGQLISFSIDWNLANNRLLWDYQL